ncbi:MAG: ATP-binding cassette domain-containing protein [Phycisphaera sp.]|nr:ATP-binding cassette domain-containing protein [Phycisphaera sp.]
MTNSLSIHPSPAAIRVRGLVKRFEGKTVLDGIDLDIPTGQTTVIMGGSGSGKSTLLRCIIGSFPPEEGTIEFLGVDLTHATETQRNEIRKQFGVLFQSGALFNSMTLAQNVALPLEEHTSLPAETVEIMVKIKLELVGLREHADKFPSQVSGGMKKRAGLARALALDPKVLFYDEPSAGLDPVTSAEIDQLILSLTKQLGVTSVVVTHEMDSAFTIADRMAMLDKGRMLKVDSRDYFDTLRKTEGELPETQALIRQFLRGDAEGPITQRKQGSSYEEDLLGKIGPSLTPRPSVQATRVGR